MAAYWSPVPTLTEDELEHEREWLEGCFDSYREIGQGISSKEHVRYRQVLERLCTVFGKIYAPWH